MTALGYIGDGLWILALAIMFGTSRNASKRTDASTLLVAGVSLPRNLVLWALPGGAFLFSLWLLLEAHHDPASGDQAIMLFGLRALSASTLALIHLRIIHGAVKP